jgi:hypothetical protein
MAINLATWKAEIRRIFVRGQPGQKVWQTPSKFLCTVPTLSFQARQAVEIGRITVPGQPRQKKFGRLHLNGKELGVVYESVIPATGCSLLQQISSAG